MKLPLIIFSFLAFFAANTQAQEDAGQHPIDKKMEECIQKDGSTSAMNMCMDKARADWDKEMNRVYNALMKKLPAKEQAALKASQKAWLTHRDLEIKNIDNVYAYIYDKSGGGTMYSLIQNDALTQIIKARTLQLSGLLTDIEQFVEGKGQ
jgi:uncharacterized protein YecT (DUF1311 family)